MADNDQDRFRVTVRIEIAKMEGQNWQSSERLSVNHEFNVSAAGFTQVAGILGQFQELSETIKAEQQ